MKNNQVIFITGTSYSASTLLDMILSNDKNGFSLGEVNAFFRPYRKHHIEQIKIEQKNHETNTRRKPFKKKMKYDSTSIQVKRQELAR